MDAQNRVNIWNEVRDALQKVERSASYFGDADCLGSHSRLWPAMLQRRSPEWKGI